MQFVPTSRGFLCGCLSFCCSPLGVCNQELEKLEFLEELKNLELLEPLEPLEKPTSHQTKKKNKVGVAQNPPLKN